MSRTDFDERLSRIEGDPTQGDHRALPLHGSGPNQRADPFETGTDDEGPTMTLFLWVLLLGGLFWLYNDFWGALPFVIIVGAAVGIYRFARDVGNYFSGRKKGSSHPIYDVIDAFWPF